MCIKQKAMLYLLGVAILCGASHNSVHAATHSESSVEAEVRAFFADVPAMIAIAQCESKFRQYDDLGQPLRGGWGGGMIGVFQIYESIHQYAASELGFDLTTLEGNLGYARHLYEDAGTSPWNSAKSCWEHAALDTPLTEVAELQKKIATLQVLVAQLEQLLAQKKSVSRIRGEIPAIL